MRQFDPSVREWMDVDQPVSPELERDLDNLVTLNRWFGSHTLVLDFLRQRLDASRSWRLLDLATGSGDIPRAIARWAAKNHILVSIDAVDAQRSTIEIARRRSAEFSNLHFHEGDIRSFGTGQKWDIVLCSLAMHHFTESDAVDVLRHAALLSHRHVLISDLRRCTLAIFAVDLLTALWMREPMTRNDARISVRRAFSFKEFAALAHRAEWRHFDHTRRFCFRQAIWLHSS